MSSNQSNINTVLNTSTQNIPPAVQTSNINKDPLSNLDPSKLAQLTPEQRAKFKSLSPDQVKALNNLPIGQLKNLTPDQLKKQAATLKDAQNKLKDAKAQLEKGIGNAKKKLEALRKANDPKSFLNDIKSQLPQSPREAALVAANIVYPILAKFISVEKITDLLINKLINDSKKKLKDKGRFVVINGAITFSPKDKGNYIKFKQNFDRKVESIKKTVNIIKTINDTLVIILKVFKAAVAAFNVYAFILKKRLDILLAQSIVELATLSPAKPKTIEYELSKINYDTVIEPLKIKINDYGLIISLVQTTLQIYKKMTDTIKRKLDTLSFTIEGLPDSAALQESLNSYTQVDDTNIEITDNNGGRQYTIKVVTTLSGALQAVAYDKFSMMKIIQTAPSKTRGADELVNELKQILGQ